MIRKLLQKVNVNSHAPLLPSSQIYGNINSAKDIKTKMDDPIIINGKEMPFTAEELVKVLSIMKKSVGQAAEGLSTEDDQKVLDTLLDELNHL